jgi:tetratricopeptide (TPR) repeat protein
MASEGSSFKELLLNPGVTPVPGYQLVRRLGAGGCGEVWEAQGPGGFTVAMKFVRLTDEASAVELRAVDVMKNIRHANVLSVFGAWQISGYLVLAMERADGTLMDRLRSAVASGLTGIPTAELLDCMRDAARGLDFLNDPRAGESVGIQHRDVKPANLLLVGGSVRLGDFGLAKFLGASIASHTGNLTPAYAAPECFDGQTTRHSDQYSLAVTYCQLRSNRLPFRGDAVRVMRGHMHEAPDLTMLPETERTVVARALAKKPADRYSSCRAFVEALAPMMTGPPTAAVKQDETASAHETRILAQGRTEMVSGQPTRRRLPVGAVFAIATMLLLLTVQVFYFFWWTKPVGNSIRANTEEKKAESGVANPGDTERKTKSDSANPGNTEEKKTENGSTNRENMQEKKTENGSTNRENMQEQKAEKRDPAREATALLKQGDYDKAVALLNETIPQEESAVLYDLRGRAYLRKHDYSKALSDLDAALKLDANLDAARRDRAEVHVEMLDADRAIEDCDFVLLRTAGKDAEARTVRARAYLQRYETALALDDADEAVKLDSKSADALATRGVAKLRQGDRDGAQEDCNQALDLQPDSVNVLNCRAVVLTGCHEFDKAAEDLNRAEEIDPRYARTFGNRGGLLRQRGDFEGAIKACDRALELQPTYYLAAFTRGRAYGAQKDYQKEEKSFDLAIQLNPRYTQAFAYRAAARRKQGKHERAIEDCERAIKLDPAFAMAYFERGLNRRYLQNLTKAVTDFDEAITLRPRYSAAWAERGNCYRLLKKYTEAVRDLDEAIRLDPESAFAHAIRGDSYRMLKKYDEAISDLTEAIRRDSRYAFAYSTRGATRHSQGKTDEAIEDLKIALNLDPSFAWAWNMRGVVYLGRKDYTKAKSDFDEAIRLSPNWSVPYSNRARCYTQLKQTEKAEADRAKARELEGK